MSVGGGNRSGVAGASIGSGAAPVNKGPIQIPGGRVTSAEFIRTTNPGAMNRKQRRMCDTRLGRNRSSRAKPW